MDVVRSERGPGRPTMSVREAALLIGVSDDTVRLWVDRAEVDGTPVAVRERDALGRPVPGTHRRPYVDAVEEWARRRAGEVGQSAGGGPAGG